MLSPAPSHQKLIRRTTIHDLSLAQEHKSPHVQGTRAKTASVEALSIIWNQHVPIHDLSGVAQFRKVTGVSHLLRRTVRQTTTSRRSAIPTTERTKTQACAQGSRTREARCLASATTRKKPEEEDGWVTK